MKKIYFLIFTCFALICGGSQVSTVSGRAKAPHFDAVNKHLDLGGDFYLYVDLDQDVEKAAELLNEAYKELDLASKTEIEDLDFLEIAKIMGFDGIDAFGASSYKDGDMFVNKSFLRTTEGRKGFLKIFGQEPKKFNILDFAPDDASLLVEQDLHIKSAYDVFMELLAYFNAKDVLKEIEDIIKDPILPDLFSIKEVLDVSNTRMMASFSIDNAKKIQFLDVLFPHIDFMFAVENLGIVFDILMETAGMIPFFRTETTDDWQIIEIIEEIPELDYQLVFKRDLNTDRLYVASNMRYLKKCLDAKGSFKNNKDFKKAAQNVNVLVGNSFAYYSPSFFSDISNAINQIEINDESVSWVQKLITMILPTQKEAQLMVSRNTTGGILTESRTYYSYKTSLLVTTIYLNPASFLLMGSATKLHLLERMIRHFFGNNEPYEPYEPYYDDYESIPEEYQENPHPEEESE